MGLREFGFLLNSVTNAQKILELINLHNEMSIDINCHIKVGKPLEIIGYLNLDNKCWLYAVNRGGFTETSDWLNLNMPLTITWFCGNFNRPYGWIQANEFIYKNSNENSDYSLPTIINECICE